jgi:hypothetical protein
MDELAILSPFSLDSSNVGFLLDSTASPSAISNCSSSYPQLMILRQNSLSTETFSRNGIQKVIHVVVKNQPFLIQLGLGAISLMDFARFPVEARLVYDCDSFKEVDFVKLKPVEYKCHVGDRPDQVTVEMKIKVSKKRIIIFF